MNILVEILALTRDAGSRKAQAFALGIVIALGASLPELIGVGEIGWRVEPYQVVCATVLCCVFMLSRAAHDAAQCRTTGDGDGAPIGSEL